MTTIFQARSQFNSDVKAFGGRDQKYIYYTCLYIHNYFLRYSFLRGKNKSKRPRFQPALLPFAELWTIDVKQICATIL